VLLVFLFLFISLNMMISSSIHIHENYVNSLFYDWIILHCVYIPNFLYSIISWWTPRLILQLGYHEKYCCKDGCAGVSIVCILTFLWIYVQEQFNWIIR
jgi:hypothetical protein